MATSSVLGGRPTSAEQAATPDRPSRDRFVDVLRAFAIVALVGQHWMLPVLSGDGAVLTTGGSPTVLGGSPTTFLSPALPLIFFAGGAATAIGLRNRQPPAGATRPEPSWLADRMIRLAAPALPLAAGWLLLPRVLVASGTQAEPVYAAAEVVGRLLWFLAAYALLVSLTPILVRLHEQCRGRDAIVMATGAVAVDIVRLTGPDRVGWLGSASIVLVLGAAYQVGIAYSRGRLDNVRRSRMLALGSVGVAAGTLAVAVGPDVVSVIDMSLPATVMLALAAGQLGLAFTLRGALTHWAAHLPVGAMLDWISARTVTIYLWHVPALLVVSGISAVGFGYGQGRFGAGWYSDVPLRLAALTIVLAGCVRAFGRYERRESRRLAHRLRGRASLNPNPPVCRVGSSAPGRKT